MAIIPEAQRVEASVPKKNNTSEYKSEGTAYFSSIRGKHFIGIGLLSFLLMLFLAGISTVASAIMGILFFVSMYVLKFGAVRIREKEVVVVERWGAYLETLKPGLNFTIPFGVDKLIYKEEEKKLAFSERATKLPMFLDPKGNPLKIEFKLSTENGVDFGVYYIIVNREKAIYFADDLELYVKDKVENCAKAAFGATLVEEAIENKLEVVANTHKFMAQSTFMKKSANELLADAGVEIESVYFNDIDLSEETKKKRKEIFDQQQAAKIKEHEAKAVEAEGKVEEKRVKVEKQKSLQEEVKGQATRKRFDSIRGKKKELSDQEVASYEIQMKKYQNGVQDVTEINVGGQGGSNFEQTIAKAAALLGSTAVQAGKAKVKSGEKKVKETKKIAEPKKK